MAFNRRLIFWLIKAYIKRWGKIFVIFFLVGLGIFFILKQFLLATIVSLASQDKQTIGVVGAYTVGGIPNDMLSHLSEGLTTVGNNGIAKPALASSWRILDDGKTYQFTLKKGMYFTDGTPVTSKEINLSYSDVKVDRPNAYTIIFHLKENYAPFLLTVSKPIFRKNFVGIGPYTLQSLKLNGSFVESMSMRTKDGSSTITYQFYPTQDALKIGFVLGEISQAAGLTDMAFQNTSLTTFHNATIAKTVRHDLLVTLFYNTQDKVLSDKKIRDAISYVIPNSFIQGERAYSPLSPESFAYSLTNQHTQDFTHAGLLLDAAGGAKNMAPFVIDALPKYKNIAQIVASSMKKVGLKTKIVIVDSIPDRFQMFLGDFAVSKDPDQYTLWHSYQSNNISNYNDDKRVDKLLEDGRQTVDMGKRVQIYSDFQKYLLDGQPATFLYFPYSYTVKRMLH